jgi:glucokinase
VNQNDGERSDEGDLIIGVDVGGTKVLAAAVEVDGRISAKGRIDTLPQAGPMNVIARVAGLLAQIAEQSRGPGQPIAAVTLGVPGWVDDGAGRVHQAPNLPGWSGLPLAQLLRARLGESPRIILDNDVNLAVLGEYVYGVGRGLQSMVGVYVGTGIGGGLILDGRLYRGAHSAAAEVGHTIVAPKGPRCRCGQRGCVEALASRTAMERDVRACIAAGKKSNVLRLMKKRNRQRMTASIVQRALREGDPVMRKVLRRAQKYVGLLCANLVNTLDPQLVLIGGGLAERLGEELVTRIREVAYDRFFRKETREQIRILPTQLKADAGPLGGAWLARQRLGLLPETGVALH